MATYRIHEDIKPKNENIGVIKKTIIAGKDKRTTFAVLNNIPLEARTHASKTMLRQRDSNIISIKNTGKINDENEVPKEILHASKKVDPKVAVPVDQFKAFCVYEDGGDENKRPAEDSAKIESIELPISANTSLPRQPFQEIKQDDLLETPMSVSDMLSPMSVDKSIIESSLIIEKQRIAEQKCKRDLLFEIEEYQLDILEHLKEAETKHLPKYGYMRKQPDINHSMRTILVDWLVEVCEEYRLQSETLCLAVSYIDRFLSIMSVVRAKLQLVGTAAMFIASKYEEIYPPDVGEFVYITDHTYTKKQVLRMEQLILKVLTFDLSVPTTYTFVNLFAIWTTMPDQIKFLANYVCELSLLESEPYLKYLPSTIAAASIALARYNLDYPIWSKKLEESTGYSLEQLKEVIIYLSRSHIAAVNSPQQAIQDKYKSARYTEVSILKPLTVDEPTYAIAVSEWQEVDENADTNESNNENVRKMISSLIFV